MSARRLLLIDPDENFFHILHEQVSPYGFEIYKVEPSPDALGYVDELRPELVFIAVEEPDKLGYSLCNKAKKGVARDIPVILTTSSVPPSGFLSHRKLRVHADEYIDKRSMRTRELMFKMEQLIGLGELVVDDGPYDDIDDFELDDAFSEEGERTRIAPPGMLGFDLADAGDAVDALVDGDHSFFDDEDDAMSTSASIPQFFRDGPSGPSPAPYENRRPETVLQEQPASGGPPPPVEPPITAQQGRSSGTIRRPSNVDLGLDQVAQAPPSAPKLSSRIRELEEENQRLQAQVQTKPAASGSAFSREREFLNLRELVNKKEREVLDLRDEVGSKERAILDGKEQIRQLLHTKTELDQKNLELEQRLLAFQEQLDALNKEKSQHVEQSRDLERSVAEAQAHAQAEIETMAGQLNELQTQLASAQTAVKEESERHASKLTEQETRYAEDKALLETRLTEEKNAALSELKTELEARISSLGANNNQAIDALKAEHEQALERTKEEHAQTLQAATAAHETATGELRERHLQELNTAENAHTEALANAANQAATEHENVLKTLKDEHEQKITELQTAQKQTLEELKSKSKIEAEEQRSQAETQLRDAFDVEKETLERIHQKALSELESERKSLQADLETANARLEGLGTRTSESEAKLSEMESKLSDTEASVEQHLETIAKRDTRIGSLEMDIEELENNNKSMQEQVLFAYKKIRLDESTVAKAKKALAIALTLLDDNIQVLTDDSAPADKIN